MLAGRIIKVKQFVTFQMLLILVGTFFLFWFGSNFAFSYLLGAGLMFIANFLMLWRLFIKKRSYSAITELMFLYLGEFLKLLAIAVGTVLIVIYIKPYFMMYLLGLVILQVAMWMMPFFLSKHNEAKV